MNLDTYQLKAAKTAIYPDHGSGSITAVSYLGLGLGEAGEVQGKIKKIMRDEPGMTITDVHRVQLMGELGDLLWYIANLSSELGLSLDAVANSNLAKLADRADRGVLTGSGDER